MAHFRPAPPGVYERSPGHQLLELFGIAAALASVLTLLWRCVEGIVVVGEEGRDAVASHVASFCLAIAGGSLLSDVSSGIVHFTFDRFFSIDTPLIGRNFVHPFRQHHADPKAMTRHGFVETNGNNSLATCVPLFILLAIPFDYRVGWQRFIVAIVVSAAIGLFLTNQFHKWAHEDDPPQIARWLQDRGLILPRRHHQLHHTWPYDSHYCITTGWSNALLRRLGFWPRLEWFCTRLLRMRLYTETTPWEQLPGSPAFHEREHMATTPGR